MEAQSTPISYSYATEGSLIRIEAITAAGIAAVWHVSLAEALSFAIKQSKESHK